MLDQIHTFYKSCLCMSVKLMLIYMTLLWVPHTQARWTSEYIQGIGFGYPQLFYLSPTYTLYYDESSSYLAEKGFLTSVDLGLRASSLQLGIIWIQGRDNPDSYARISLAASALLQYNSKFENGIKYYGIKTNAHWWFLGIDLGVYRQENNNDYLFSAGLRLFY